MTIMPFGLEDESKVVEVLLTFLVPILFIAIERTAIIMQDPFENILTDTPMTALSMTIEKNLLEMVEQDPPSPEDTKTSYFIM